MPTQLPLSIYRGDTGQWTFKLWTDSTKTTPVNLTGATAASEIRSDIGGILITTFNVVITLPNIINITLTSANSSLLSPLGGAWDLQLTYANGTVQTVVYGNIDVKMDVTNSAPLTFTQLRKQA